ncbi:MAG: ATP-binding protein, partial [Myxococcota bacterium]
MDDILPDRWTESMLDDLEPHEHDFQEFKGHAWMVDHDLSIPESFLLALSKQVSAFANGAGGRLFIGLDDDGHV